MPNTQPTQVEYNFMALTEVVAPTVSIDSNTAIVNPPPNPPNLQPVAKGEGGTTSTRTRKKIKVISSVWNDFELSIIIQTDGRKERWARARYTREKYNVLLARTGRASFRNTSCLVVSIWRKLND